MIKKILAFALFSGLSAIAFSAEKQNLLEQDSTQLSILLAKIVPPHDTISSQQFFGPLFSEPGPVYKQRLDSTQQTVALSYNEHVQDYINLYINRKAQIGKMLGLSKYYFPIFEKSFAEVGIPDELKYISIVESALNPHAVSRSGAVGPWQFMFTTAKGYGLKMDNYVDERKDPVLASHAAALYLRDAYNKLGDWLLAIAAYNCGTGGVTRAIAKAGGNTDFWAIRSYLPRETQNYVPAFIATVYAMKYHQKHDIYPQEAGFNILTDVIDVNRVISLSNIAKAADIDLKELMILNPSYKKQIVNGSNTSSKQLVIPAIQKHLYASLYEVLNNTPMDNGSDLILASNNAEQHISNSQAKHSVKEGQTLLMVANQYGIEVQDLKVFNNLKTPQLVPGQVLKLKAEKPVKAATKSPRYFTYIVKAGDTLSEIASKFSGATTSKIKALNGLKKSTVKVGMKLKINKG